MKALLALVVGAPALLTTGVTLAQSTNMMNDGSRGAGWMGGYAGAWMPFLLVIVVVALVVLVLKGRGK
ncbi:hypothetical protein [Polaromonas sp. CG9_12]|uniref:hypothetical protein n=1 Tax=Polaromonas sp. CG_9.11 TaxID=2787730 RepID=UPI0004DDCDEE|nr:hypothetical protein [Polaromonas sp. CG_9.11]MBG6075752.1 putative membrane protein [Polaromonas sp. CG_9.11]CDS51753.1 hypothetical protein [Polaromonas sp. CG9_12]